VGQEYFINSQELQDKVSSLLPSQGGAGSGFDLSASTQIIPIIDLTESAEGSNVRADIQSAFSYKSITSFNVSNTSADVITSTGYYRVFGNCFAYADGTASCALSDGLGSKIIIQFRGVSGADDHETTSFDFIVFIPAGNSFTCTTNNSNAVISGVTRQIADINGVLVNP